MLGRRGGLGGGMGGGGGMSGMSGGGRGRFSGGGGSDSDMGGKTGHESQTGHSIHMRGLPFAAVEQDILDVSLPLDLRYLNPWDTCAYT